MDSDDWLDECAYERMLELIISKNADVLACGFIEENVNTSICKFNKSESGVYRGRELDKILETVLYTGIFYEAGVIPSLWGKTQLFHILHF